jgi:8-oxo-dGTP pyrophosphatase MutT (NUDIX family)
VNLHAEASEVIRRFATTAADDDQRQLAARFEAFLAEHADAVYRDCRPGHLSASALVLSAGGDQVLLTLHAKERRWLQLGGHCEPTDATLAGAALREATEESGIEGLTLLPGPLRLDRHQVGCHGGSWHYDVEYVAFAPAGAIALRSEESLQLAWFPRDRLPEPTDDALRKLVAAAPAASPSTI